jgi:hypothetical protein
MDESMHILFLSVFGVILFSLKITYALKHDHDLRKDILFVKDIKKQINSPALKTLVQIHNVKNLSPFVFNELKNIAIMSGEKNLIISSRQRSVKKQVEVMLDYYITCEKKPHYKSLCGIELARKTYHSDCHAAFSVYDSKNTRKKNVSIMAKRLKQALIALGEKRRCMNHVVISHIKTPIIAVDIKPSSIKNPIQFYEAVKKNKKVIQFYYPKIKGKSKSDVKDSAFHLEFLREFKE